MRGDDFPRGDLERGKQRRRAMSGVVVALAGQSAPVWQLQIALRPLQSLDRRLFIDAQNNRFGGSVHIKADDIGGLGGELGIVALAPGLARRQIDLVVPQTAPDILNVDVTQRLSQQRSTPAGKAFRRRLVQKSQDPFVRRRRIEGLLTRTRLVFQPIQTVVGIAMPPAADNPRLNPNLLGNRTGAAAFSRQQHNPRSLQILLHRTRRTATSLQLLAITPRKANFSCFGYHPNLESRLTFLEKGVLGRPMARPCRTMRRRWYFEVCISWAELAIATLASSCCA